MNLNEYKFTREKEWLYLESNDIAKIGLTHYACLGDITLVDLPEPGTTVDQFGKMGEVQLGKTLTDIYSPVSGEVLEINHSAIKDISLVNKDPYGDGWLVRIELKDITELENLMNKTECEEFIGEKIE